MCLNTAKTKELIADFRSKEMGIRPLAVNRICEETASVSQFLGVHIEADLYWGANTSGLVKKVEQRLNFLKLLSKNNIFEHCVSVAVLHRRSMTAPSPP